MPLNALKRWWQGRPAAPEAKASRTGGLIAMTHLGRAVWTPRDYEHLAREGFMRNAVAYRCVRMIAEGASSVPWLLYAGDQEITAHPLLDLLDRPNPREAGASLLEAWYSHLLTSGNAYLEAVSAGGNLRELYALRSDRVKAVPGPDGWPQAYEYTVGGQSVRFETEAGGFLPILHMKFFHPLNDHYGMSPAEAAATAIDIHNAGAEWGKALLDNAARPSGALIYRGPQGAPHLTETQAARLRAELEESFQGAANAGRPLLLEGGLEWQPMAMSPVEMGFIESRHMAAREIALAFGVPPMLLGIPGDNTYANYREAQLALWRHTILPLAARTGQALSHWLGPRMGEAVRLVPDADQVEALSVDRDALWQRLASADFLTTDEKRVAAGYSPLGPHAEDGTGQA